MMNQAYEPIAVHTDLPPPTGAAPAVVVYDARHAESLSGRNRIRDRGGFSIAQDEASCVVFDTPSAEIAFGLSATLYHLNGFPGSWSNSPDRSADLLIL